MEKLNWKIEGMSCTNCALTIDKYLTGKGMQQVKVNFIGGDLSFESDNTIPKNEIEKGIEALGYHVITGEKNTPHKGKRIFKNHLQRFTFCIIFTAPLLAHMIPGIHIHVLMNPYVQLCLTLPVFIVGMDYFGRSALKSILKGVPNMNVLIAIGATAAFGYSLYGTLTDQAAQYMFYETTATILSLVFLGNWMEDRSVQSTQAALRKLAVSQKTMANMIAYDDKHEEHIFQVDSQVLKTGDLLLIKTGESVPADCKILWGDAEVNEAIFTGESLPVHKKMTDTLIGGSLLQNGTVKAYVTAAGQNTVLSHILQMVKEAQSQKPPIQQLADRISAIFVPVVVSLSFITILINYFAVHESFSTSLLRGIAVLVISCPCAMGLATPASIAVGLGRAAKNGILFKNARSLELFKSIQQIVFDKTGTLTTGEFSISGFQITESFEKNASTGNQDEAFKRIVFSLEKYSNHPLAKTITKNWKCKDDLRWAKIEEIKGRGMKASDKEGNIYTAGSYQSVSSLTKESTHNMYITCNAELIGWIDLVDEIRPEAYEVIRLLKAKGFTTILLSGDRKEKCEQVARQLGIDQVYAEQTPEQKLQKIESLNTKAPTAMVGDGINDAPALAKATVGISVSDASHLAMQSADVVLMNNGLQHLPLALGLGKHTYITIQENLFWAFAYNIIAIPVAAMGYLSPGIAALLMGFSDVVLAINSLRLNFKKVV